MKPHFKTVESPTREHIDLIGGPLSDYNKSKVGAGKRHEFTIYAYADNGKLIGGMYAWLAWGWLNVDIAWVDETIRQSGVGTQLLAACEQYAVARGIRHARLNTGSFQALDFYKKNGYTVFTQLDIVAPDGSAQVDYFLRKDL